MTMLMNDDIFRKQLLFRCWHRGTREMDLILGRFAEARLGGMDNEQLQDLAEFLQESDVDIYNWVSNKETAPANTNHTLLGELRKFHSL